MTDHTIEAHFKVSSDMGFDRAMPEDERVIRAMAKGIAGEENADHPMALFEAAKIYRAVTAMREAMSNGRN